MMASSHDVPDSFDYDVLADVSQHGSSVFDFLSQPTMFGPTGLAAPHMNSPSFSSPLGHHRPPLDHPLTSLSLAQSVPHTVSDAPMQLHTEAPPPHIPTISTIPSDVAMSPPSLTADEEKNESLGPSAKETTPGKKQSGTSAKPEKKAEKKSGPVSQFNRQGPFASTSQLQSQSESFCTTDTASKQRLAVAPSISKPERRTRSTRSDPTKPVRMDASMDANGSLTASVEASALHSPSAVDELEPNKDVHNSHTRRCRAKVNNKFQELLKILPKPPPKTGVKHKAQILDYTIRVFREIYAKKLHLEAELALSSRAQLNTWVDSVVGPASQLADILNPFMSLICTKEKWQFAESWVPALSTGAAASKNGAQRLETSGPDPRFDAGQSVSPSQRLNGGQFKNVGFNREHDSASMPCNTLDDETISGESRSLVPPPPVPQAPLRLGTVVIPSAGNFDDPDLQSKLEKFRDRSHAFICKPRVDPPGRIMCTMRPEWLPSLADEEAFQRASLAKEASLSVCFGIPFFVRGHVAAVVVFFDVEQRPYDAKCVDLAGSIAGLLGNAFGARSVEDPK